MDKKEINKQKNIHYKKLAKPNNIESVLWLADYYSEIGKDKQMLKFLIMAAKRKHVDSMARLGDYYNDKNDETNMRKYYDMAIANGRCDVAIKVINYYYSDNKKYKKFVVDNKNMIEKYCNVFMDNYKPGYNTEYYGVLDKIFSHISGIYNSIIYNENKFHDDFYEKINIFVVKHFKDEWCIFRLGKYYEDKKEHEKIIKCYLIGVEKGYPNIMLRLGFYYFGIKNYEKYSHYMLMAINVPKTSKYYSKHWHTVACHHMMTSHGSKSSYHENMKKLENIKKVSYANAIVHDDFSDFRMIGYYYIEHHHDFENIFEREDDEKVYFNSYNDHKELIQFGKQYNLSEKKYILLMQKYIENKIYVAYYELALLYENNKNEEKMLEHLHKGVEKNDIDSLFKLTDYYKSNNIHLYNDYTKQIISDDSTCLDYLIYYINKNDKDKMIFYLKTILKESKNEKLKKHGAKIFIEHCFNNDISYENEFVDTPYIIGKIGDFYYIIKKFDKMIEYYNKAMEYYPCEYSAKLIDYYCENDKYNETEKLCRVFMDNYSDEYKIFLRITCINFESVANHFCFSSNEKDKLELVEKLCIFVVAKDNNCEMMYLLSCYYAMHTNNDEKKNYYLYTSAHNGCMEAMLYAGREYLELENYFEAEKYLSMLLNINKNSKIFSKKIYDECVDLMSDNIDKCANLPNVIYLFIINHENYDFFEELLEICEENNNNFDPVNIIIEKFKNDNLDVVKYFKFVELLLSKNIYDCIIELCKLVINDNNVAHEKYDKINFIIGKYYESINVNCKKAKECYDKIINKCEYKYHISKFNEKKSMFDSFIKENNIISGDEIGCEICCCNKNIIVNIKCCNDKMICDDCIFGIMKNDIFMCPYCRFIHPMKIMNNEDNNSDNKINSGKFEMYFSDSDGE